MHSAAKLADDRDKIKEGKEAGAAVILSMLAAPRCTTLSSHATYIVIFIPNSSVIHHIKYLIVLLHIYLIAVFFAAFGLEFTYRRSPLHRRHWLLQTRQVTRYTTTFENQGLVANPLRQSYVERMALPLVLLSS